MYVCGVNGTGKTATISGVVRSLQLQSNEKNLPKFELIQINGMQLTEPERAYIKIYQHLTGKEVHWEVAVSRLERLFKSKERTTTTILVADEFETLKSRGQRVIYNLLEWALHQNAHLFVVAISNTENIEQLGGITSRFGATRFIFQPYTQLQLQTIVQARLAGINIFENDAIQLVAR